jgi:ribosomal protein L1
VIEPAGWGLAAVREVLAAVAARRVLPVPVHGTVSDRIHHAALLQARRARAETRQRRQEGAR